MRVRFKPIVVEAEQFHPDKLPWPVGVEGVPSPGADNWNYAGCKFYVANGDFLTPISPGDWVIVGQDGTRLPCPHHVFLLTYEEVPNP